MPDDQQATQPDRLLEVVGGALERDPAMRPAFLDAACAGDAALRAEAESLLRLDEPARDFISRPAIAARAAAFLEAESPEPPAATLRTGQTLDEFQIKSLLGVGGMGEVYLAEDTSLGRQVAIKLVKAGMASQTLRQRFGEEKRILAGLNDPHIARLYGGGVTPDGLPYLVMEYVEGERVDEYCDRRRLSVEQRLTLFRKVCAAVAHAHQHLVVHRDLKPANIRVTPEGEPKLLDFGIAKLLDPQADPDHEQTVTQLWAMTPGYASPEQLRGEAVTTATDIYSLGVVLHELLTGRRPFETKRRRPADLARAVCEETVARPGSILPAAGVAEARGTTPGRLRRQLAGDLDNIILMAMRREPARRYASVSQFSEDIRRHLDGLPVAARKETLRYVGAKLIARNKTLTAAAALVLLTLVGGILATTWQTRRADEQRRRADRRFEDVRRLADSLMGEINDSVETLAGSTPTRKLIVARALEYLDNLRREADTPALRRDLAAAYEKIGNVQGNPYLANLGDTEGALASYTKAEGLLRSLADPASPDATGVRMALGRIDRALGDIHELKGDFAGMLRAYRDSLEVFAQLARERPSDPEVIDELARAYGTLGDGLDRTENGTAEQVRCFEQALVYRQKLVALDAGNTKYRRGLAVVLMKLGGVTLTDKTHGVSDITRAVTGLKAISEEKPDDVRARRDYAMSLYTLGWAEAEVGDYVAAASNHQTALTIRAQIAAADPSDAQAQYDLAVAHSNLADALTKSGQPEKALDHANLAVTSVEKLMAIDPGNTGYVRNAGLFYIKEGDAQAALGARETLDAAARTVRWSEARTAYQKAKEMFLKLDTKAALHNEDKGMLDNLAAKVSECDTQTAHLKQ